MKAKLFFFFLCAVLAILTVVGASGFAWGRNQLITQKEAVNEKKLELDNNQKRIDQLIQLSRRYETAKSRADEIDRARALGVVVDARVAGAAVEIIESEDVASIERDGSGAILGTELAVTACHA